MIVFVHGVPETARIWDQLRRELDAPSLALQLPGFGCPRPEGFGATKDDYADWVIGELEAIGEPVDLVGHDWGAGLTYRVATSRSDLLRSWVADVGSIVHPDYVWHDIAQLWQTPVEGEAVIEAQSGMSVADLADGLTGMGVPSEGAAEMAEGWDSTMGACILDLYRSAVPNIHATWGPWAPTGAPGMVLDPSDDPFSTVEESSQVAEALGARYEPFPECGHFWPYQAPGRAAAVLASFWASLD